MGNLVYSGLSDGLGGWGPFWQAPGGGGGGAPGGGGGAPGGGGATLVAPGGGGGGGGAPLVAPGSGGGVNGTWDLSSVIFVSSGLVIGTLWDNLESICLTVLTKIFFVVFLLIIIGYSSSTSETI